MLEKAFLEITNVCNLSCSFCHKTSRPHRMMTENEFEVLTDRLRGHIRYLYFHLMGEPTLHPLLPKFIRRAKEKDFLPMITTNGSLLGKIEGELLSSLPHKMSISLHAPAANVAFADPSYLDNCIRFAKQASAMGCITVLRLWNLGSEDESTNGEIIKKLHEAFEGEWQSVRSGCGMRLSERLFLEFANRFDWPDESAPEAEAESQIFCHGLRDQIGVLVDGSVVPCCLDADGVITLGNLFEATLDEIITSERAVKIYDGFSRRCAVEELCRKCGYARRF